MNIVELPLVEGTATLDEAIDRMRKVQKSASVVLVGGDYYLLGLRRAIEACREWSHKQALVNQVVRGYRVPNLFGVDLTSWAADPERVLGGDIKSFSIDTGQSGVVSASGEWARIATQFEWIAAIYEAQPVLYECNVNPDHLWTAAEVDASLDCPSITHSDPRPKCKRV
jgi:hypothetical protein